MRNNLHFTIQQYLNGMLDPQAMHALEKEALEDQFLAEALEGYHSVKPTHANLSILQQQLHTRIAKHRVEKTTVTMSARRLSVAAVAGLFLILSSILFWMIAFEGDTKQQSVSQVKTDRTMSAFSVTGNVEPVIGWQQYDRYVRNNLRKTPGAVQGSVVLEANIVNKQFEQVKILKGLTAGQNAEAIRLITEGPAWKASGTEPGRARITIHFNP